MNISDIRLKILRICDILEKTEAIHYDIRIFKANSLPAALNGEDISDYGNSILLI